jgi:hypothetical protein
MEFGCVGFNGKPGLKVIPSLDAFCLNAGLMKPWKGFTPVGNKKLGVGKESNATGLPGSS